MWDVPRPSRVDKRWEYGLTNNLETNPDEKSCLSSEIEVPQVEKVVTILQILHREILGFHHFFNLWGLYLRAQTLFFITVCFKTQAFDLYNWKNQVLECPKPLSKKWRNGSMDMSYSTDITQPLEHLCKNRELSLLQTRRPRARAGLFLRTMLCRA